MPRAVFLPSLFSQPNQQRDQALANRGEGQLLDNAYQAAQPGTDKGQYFERNFRVVETVISKVLARDKCNLSLIHGNGRSRIRATVKHRQFGNRLARTVQGKNLFASASRAFEDSHPATQDDVQSRARFAFAEQKFAGGAVFSHRLRRQHPQFRLGEAGKQGCIAQHL